MCFPNWKQRRRRRRRISWRFNQQSTAESRFADFELPTSSRRQTGAAATERQIPVFPFEKEEEEEEKERVCRRKKKFLFWSSLYKFLFLKGAELTHLCRRAI